MIYCIPNYNVVIIYPNYLETIIKFVFSKIVVSVEKPKTNGQKIKTVILDESCEYHELTKKE